MCVCVFVYACALWVLRVKRGKWWVNICVGYIFHHKHPVHCISLTCAMDILFKLRVLNLHVLCLCSSWQPGLLWRWRSNQVLLHMFLVSAPCFPQRAGQLIASLIIGGPGRGHEYHLAHSTANMAGFLFHLPLKLNHFCAKIDCCKFA